MKIKFNARYEKGKKDEYLSFTVLEDCNIHDYIIYDTTFDGNGDLSNLLPHMYRFPHQDVIKNAVVFLYVHSIGSKKAIEKEKTGRQVYRFSWGLADDFDVFNKEGDYLHIAEVIETRVKVIEGKKK